jgi:hypothetical protein
LCNEKVVELPAFRFVALRDFLRFFLEIRGPFDKRGKEGVGRGKCYMQ